MSKWQAHPLLEIEAEIRTPPEAATYKIAGVDEAGRGPLAGPVVAAAVILPLDHLLNPLGTEEYASLLEVRDSKALRPDQRASLADVIRQHCTYAIAASSPEEIDAQNIHHATLETMTRALNGLSERPDYAIIDGKFTPQSCPCPVQAIIKGDARSLSIAAASILAKAERDRIMTELDQAYPKYHWAQNKGYPSPAHKAALSALGPTPHHRQSYRPVQEALSKGS